MPTTISIAEFPIATRSAKDSPYAELIQYTADYCRNESVRLTQGFVEAVKDDAEFAKVAPAIRNAAKSVGAKVQLVYRDGKVHVRYMGQYVPLSDEAKAKRAESRKANSEKVQAAGAAAKAAKAKAGA